MSHNLGEILHIPNIIASTKINNSFDACSFILVSQNGIAKEEQRREREGGGREEEKKVEMGQRGEKGGGEREIWHLIVLTVRFAVERYI